ncbi:hypothetical protein DL98DRAFT_514748 [Cadophora sp. DSE1049]|nr:hypothetical protein DL98DRAFT_514748 [Cadophora sp. DSE1049]
MGLTVAIRCIRSLQQQRQQQAWKRDRRGRLAQASGILLSTLFALTLVPSFVRYLLFCFLFVYSFICFKLRLRLSFLFHRRREENGAQG